jgi:methylamine dehydrogenase accessory protein MauD
MTDIWLISYLSLWLIVIALAFLVLVLARQIGLLHSRLRPSGAMITNEGPEIGEMVPEAELVDLKGRPFKIVSDHVKT